MTDDDTIRALAAELQLIRQAVTPTPERQPCNCGMDPRHDTSAHGLGGGPVAPPEKPQAEDERLGPLLHAEIQRLRTAQREALRAHAALLREEQVSPPEKPQGEAPLSPEGQAWVKAIDTAYRIECNQRVAALQAEVDRLRAALSSYGDHHPECSEADERLVSGGKTECTCGLAAMLPAAEKP